MATQNFISPPTIPPDMVPMPRSGDPHKMIQRGERIRQFVLKITQQDRTISRESIQAMLKKDHGITVTISRINYQLRALGIRQIKQWSNPGAGARTRKPSAYTVKVRDILRHAVTNGQRQVGCVELSLLLMDKHDIPLVPENLRRHLNAMGFHWIPGPDGWGWGQAEAGYRKASPRASSAEAQFLAEQQIDKRKTAAAGTKSQKVCDYVKARREKWIAENGPCKCGATENLVVYTKGARKRLYWTLCDEKLKPLLAISEVCCVKCMREKIALSRLHTQEAKDRIAQGVRKYQAGASKTRRQDDSVESFHQRMQQRIAEREAAKIIRQREREAANLAKVQRLAAEREQRAELRRQAREEKKRQRVIAKRGALFGAVITEYAATCSDSKAKYRVRLIADALGHLYSGEIKTKPVRNFQRALYDSQPRSVYAGVMQQLRKILAFAGLSRVRLLKLKVGRHIEGMKFIRQYLKKASCVECGYKQMNGNQFTRRRGRKVLRMKDGSRVPSGMANLPIETIKRRLAEQLEVVCLTCQGQKNTSNTSCTDDAIKDALQSFEPAGEIVKRLNTDAKRVHRLAMELFDVGVTCLCERRLGHGECKELKMVRSSPGYVAPGQQQPAKVVVVPIEVYSDDQAPRCRSSKSCPFPVYLDGRCRNHWLIEALPDSMTDKTLDPQDVFEHEDNPSPLLSLVKVEELRRPSLKTVSPSGRWRNERNRRVRPRAART
jgi:hypothetical protein